MHVYWKESRRAAFRANVELEIVKRGYLLLERELNELRETSSVEIERLTRDAATWMEDAEKFRRKVGGRGGGSCQRPKPGQCGVGDVTDSMPTVCPPPSPVIVHRYSTRKL